MRNKLLHGERINTFSDLGLDVNKNGRDNERLLSVNSSTLSIPKQDTVTVETFLSVAGEGAKAAYVEGEDSTFLTSHQEQMLIIQSRLRILLVGTQVHSSFISQFQKLVKTSEINSKVNRSSGI
ncbi:Signal recognition particle 72 kDa protein homolog [Listeria monocytogenes]|nr:Signal recognition particle 72 kDa protein homolog [Listeria monocytogenes]